MKPWKLLATGLAVSAFLSVPPAGAAIGKHIRDWSVSCTTGLTCSMRFADWTSKGLRSLEFRRIDAPNADVQLILSPPPGFGTQGDPDGAYAFNIDGQQVLSVPVAGLGKEGINVQLVYSEQPAIRALLDAMKTGTTMEAVYQGALGRFSLPVKLSGVKGSLVYIDEVQDRLQRSDAVEAKGDKSPPKQTVAGDILSVSDLPEAIRRDFTDERGACSELDSDIGNYQGFSIMVDGNRWIVAPCGIGGAYNQPYALYVGYDVIMERISFPEIREGKPSVSSTAYNVDSDLKTKTFTAFFRGRGIGDCGLWSKWKLANGGSPTLVLLEERRKDDCNGDDLGGPQNFPLVWPTKP